MIGPVSTPLLPSSSPTSDPSLIPPLLALSPGVVYLLGVAVPPHPLGGLALGGRGTVALEEALLQRAADHLLLRHALAQLLVQGRGREGRQGAVHVGLLLAPLPLEGVRGQQLGLGGRAEVDQVRLELVQARCQRDVVVEGCPEGSLGGSGGRVSGGGRGGERSQQLGSGEEVGEILLTTEMGK